MSPPLIDRFRVCLAAIVAVATGCGPHPAANPSTPAAPQPSAQAALDAGGGGPFDGCTGVFTSVFGWTFSCDTTSVVTREGDDVEALLRGARESMRGAFAGTVDERREDVLVGGAPHKGMHLSLRSATKKIVATGTAAIVQADAGPARVIACLAGTDDASQARCRQQIDALSVVAYDDLPPAGVHLRARPAPAIAGRPVVEPPDCHLAANDRTGILDCGDAVLGWSEPTDARTIPSERDATLDDIGRKMQAATPAGQPPRRSSAACRIEGVPSTCTVVRWPDATLTVGTALVRGHSILAWCMAHDPASARICRDSVDTGPLSTTGVAPAPPPHLR